MEGFLTDIDTAMLFYQLAHDMELNTEEERIALLRLLVRDKKAKYIRSVEEYTKDKRVLHIKRKE